MEALIMVALLAMPFVRLGAAVAALIIRIGSDTARRWRSWSRRNSCRTCSNHFGRASHELGRGLGSPTRDCEGICRATWWVVDRRQERWCRPRSELYRAASFSQTRPQP